MTEIKVFAPASIANLSCGYDILGVCLDNIGDEITVRKTKKKGITIKKVLGQKLSTRNYKCFKGFFRFSFSYFIVSIYSRHHCCF